MKKTTDFLIIGGGIIGLSIARQLQHMHNPCSITIIEKEQNLGEHASGRNSGVLHSGVYYPADSLKARFTKDGNKKWQNYCEEKNLFLDKCGKLIIATSENELEGLDIIEQRALENAVEIERLDSKQASEIEPRAKTFQSALFVPSTATINPKEINESMASDFQANGGEILLDCSYIKKVKDNTVFTSNGNISAGYIINCAGLYADRIAHDFSMGLDYSMLPFKGLYLYSSDASAAPRVHIYPVPDLNNPFLGVHLTRTIDGSVKVGPTAMPALWRESYSGFSNFSIFDVLEISSREAIMFLLNKNNFPKLAYEELRKQSKRFLIKDASRLISCIDEMKFTSWGRPGIRAQLVSKITNELVMDFLIEKDDKSLHILNAVSPAWTCALSFSEYVVDQI
jgi:L-2-hydroxyglutarate oxidase LhgO|tara:strand:+ start:9767 stop:10957 length:1191 start_codon:yes stop_codon:yes gene_type:complete